MSSLVIYSSLISVDLVDCQSENERENVFLKARFCSSIFFELVTFCNAYLTAQFLQNFCSIWICTFFYICTQLDLHLRVFAGTVFNGKLICIEKTNPQELLIARHINPAGHLFILSEKLWIYSQDNFDNETETLFFILI